MCAKVARHIFALEVGTLLVNLRLCAHNYSGNTKSTLQTTACSERVRKRLALRFLDAFQCGDGTTFGFCNGVLARNLSLAVNHDGAATTLTGGGASVFGRCDVEFVS
jgi:hypothetical protein